MNEWIRPSLSQLVCAAVSAWRGLPRPHSPQPGWDSRSRGLSAVGAWSLLESRQASGRFPAKGGPLESIERQFGSSVSAAVCLHPEGNDRFLVSTPFMLDDGDSFVVVLKKEATQ